MNLDDFDCLQCYLSFSSKFPEQTYKSVKCSKFAFIKN